MKLHSNEFVLSLDLRYFVNRPGNRMGQALQDTNSSRATSILLGLPAHTRHLVQNGIFPSFSSCSLGWQCPLKPEVPSQPRSPACPLPRRHSSPTPTSPTPSRSSCRRPGPPAPSASGRARNSSRLLGQPPSSHPLTTTGMGVAWFLFWCLSSYICMQE